MGNQVEDCKLGLFQDASFAGDLRYSNSTSGGLLCVLGSHKFVPISWMCKKQTAVSHSSAESQITSLDVGLLYGLDHQLLKFGECVLETSSSKPAEGNLERHTRERVIPVHQHSDNCAVESIDHVPPNIPSNSQSTQLYIF